MQDTLVITDDLVITPVSTDDLTKPVPTENDNAQRFKHTRSTWGVSIALALKFLPHLYAGTVSDELREKRRAANRVARRSRRINRARGGK